MKARQREWLWGGLGLVVSVAVFKLWPELDLLITRYFFEASSQSFPANQSSFVQAVYVATPLLSRALFVFCCLGWLVLKMWPTPAALAWRRRMLAWLLMAVLGLGLVVDWGLKDNVGRPRPEQLQVFGNSKPFVPAFELSTHCDVNCGFVSGHAAAGFSLMTWGIWSAWPRRKRWLVIGTVAGLFIGSVRIMQGGHFLSDVIFSGWAVWLTYVSIRQTWLWLRRQGFKRYSTLA
jgi:lipid A 4'-phosphatase